MCGFFGYILRENVWEGEYNTKKDLENISSKIVHRGPDEKSIFVDERNKLGLVFQRLSILDLSNNAMQPMISKCKNWIIVFNGEIYNYRELKKRLDDKRIVWKTSSDTEVILEYIVRYGFPETVSILDGMFAISAYC